MVPPPSQESFTFTVGKLDAGMAILLGERAHLIEFPSLLLPPGVTAGSIVNIAVHQNHAEEKKRDDDFWSLQDEILETFGKHSPEPPKLNLRNVTQTSITLEWSPLQLATSKLRSLDIYKNRQRLASIPTPLQNTSTKLSGLELDTEYSIQLVLRTTGGTFPSNLVRVKTHTTANTSGIRVCFGTVEDSELLERAEAALEEMDAAWSSKVQIDTTHFVCTTPTATPTAAQASGGTVGVSGPGVEYQRALQLSIPIVQPQWILACLAEKRMVPIQQFYLGNPQTPSSASYPRPQSMSQASLTSPSANTQPKTHPSHQSVPTVHTSPASSGAANQHTSPSQPPLEPMLEETEEKSDEEGGEPSKQQPRTGRRREGTMNKSFKFPPESTPSESAPPVPDMPKDVSSINQKAKSRAEEKRMGKSKDSDEVAVASPLSVEVLPPPPIEKERVTSSVSDLDDVGQVGYPFLLIRVEGPPTAYREHHTYIDVEYFAVRFKIEGGVDDYQADDYQVPPNLENFVQSPEFDNQCEVEFKAPKEPTASDNNESESSDALWLPVAPTASSLSSIRSSPHDPDPFEAKHYYFGISFDCGKVRGPKLIYRTSKDIWVPPTGPDTYPRLMRLCDVPGDHQLSKDPGLWDIIRNEVVRILVNGGVKFSSVELVCFTWLEEKDDQEDREEEEDEDDDDGDDEGGETGEQLNPEDEYDKMQPVQVIEDGTRYTTPPTIWVGVLPDALTGAVAHNFAVEILEIVNQHGISGVEVAFRESVVHLSHGPGLFAPVDDYDHCKGVVDNLSTVLSLSVAGRNTSMQGTFTCFFRVGKELYGITARHNLFKDGRDDDEYVYVSPAPKKEVIVMGPSAFSKYLASIRAKIGNLKVTVTYLATLEKRLEKKVEDNPLDIVSANNLAEGRTDLAKLRARVASLESFYVDVTNRWSKVSERIIGYVVWAPKIDVSVPPYSYTQDFCVIRLDKKKFKNGFLGNTLSLGPEISVADLTKLMYNRDDVPSEFEYPLDGLANIQGMLTVDEINKPNNLNLAGGAIRRVIKRGVTTNTTVGTMTKFKTHTRQYLSLGTPRDSIKVTILPHSDPPGLFSCSGDSGALIIDALFKFVALLTGGTGNTDTSDITYGTPIEWVWGLIKVRFPGANLYFENIGDFFNEEE